MEVYLERNYELNKNVNTLKLIFYLIYLIVNLHQTFQKNHHLHILPL
jgi:hypothetical protein